MVALLAGLNPALTTTAAGTFLQTTDGYTQGCALDDPAIRYQLRGGILAQSETIPMWGGVGIYENLPALGSDFLGSTVGRATNVTANTAATLSAFAVFNQAINAVNNPQSPVPLLASGMGVNFYRLGCGISIPVACAASLTSLDGGITTAQVSWDFGGQQLAPYVAAYAANVFTALTRATVGSVTTVTATTTTGHGLAVGSVFTVSGQTPTGYNGTWVASAGTTGSTLKWLMTTDPGASTALGQLNAGGGALNVKINDVITNGKTVTYNAATNVATWSVGTVAVIQL